MADEAEIEQGASIETDFDLDAIFNAVPEDLALDFDLFPEQPVAIDPSLELSSNSPESAVWINEIEKFLLDEGGDAEEQSNIPSPEDFFSDVFTDELDRGSDNSAVVNGDATTPELSATEQIKGKEEKGTSGSEGGGGEDPSSKKRKCRQMRNRDSAMKSRERKKMYISDLEMKSRFLESECRRLQYALQCCTAENLALHHQLKKERAFGALSAKQESAVLFVESLLLGSLFWLMSIVCLFLSPDLLAWNLHPVLMENTSRVGESQDLGIVEARRVGNKRLGLGPGCELALMSRRYKAMRTKMKIFVVSV